MYPLLLAPFQVSYTYLLPFLFLLFICNITKIDVKTTTNSIDRPTVAETGTTQSLRLPSISGKISIVTSTIKHIDLCL